MPRLSKVVALAVVFVAGCSSAVMTADKLLADYQKDANAADAKYKGRKLTITGKPVEVVIPDQHWVPGEKRTSVSFGPTNVQALRVTCFFAADEYDGVTSLAGGQATIVGTCDGMREASRVALVDCHVVRP